MAASGWRERGVRYGRGREGRRGRGRGGGIRPLHEEGVLERAPAQAATGTSAAASVKAACVCVWGGGGRRGLMEAPERRRRAG